MRQFLSGYSRGNCAAYGLAIREFREIGSYPVIAMGNARGIARLDIASPRTFQAFGVLGPRPIVRRCMLFNSSPNDHYCCVATYLASRRGFARLELRLRWSSDKAD